VQFIVDSAAFGAPMALSSGSASLTTAALTHGYHTLAAQYSGDANFNASSNALGSNLLINSAPTPGNHTLGVTENTPFTILASKIFATDRDPDHDPLTQSNLSATTAHGGTVVLSAGSLTYTPPTNYAGADSFTYTIIDSYGATANATVNVNVRATGGQNQTIVSLVSQPDGSKFLTFAGIPGRSYNVQAAATVPSASWATLATLAAGTNGLFSFADTDATNHPVRFYRTAAAQ